MSLEDLARPEILSSTVAGLRLLANRLESGEYGLDTCKLKRDDWSITVKIKVARKRVITYKPMGDR